MKQAAFIIFISFMAMSCGSDKNKQDQSLKIQADTNVYKVYGDSLDAQNAQDITVLAQVLSNSELAQLMSSSDSVPTKIKGKVMSVCQNKGCWMKIALDSSGNELRVSFKDYGFFMPKDIAGKTVIMQGYASLDTIGVEDLRHYAQDAGKSKAEIAKIIKAEITPSFEASGVLVQQN